MSEQEREVEQLQKEITALRQAHWAQYVFIGYFANKSRQSYLSWEKGHLWSMWLMRRASIQQVPYDFEGHILEVATPEVAQEFALYYSEYMATLYGAGIVDTAGGLHGTI